MNAMLYLLLGEDYVRKVEMMYCDLCNMYLPRLDHDKNIQVLKLEHCSTSPHQNAFVKKQMESRVEVLPATETQCKSSVSKSYWGPFAGCMCEKVLENVLILKQCHIIFVVCYRGKQCT